MSYIDSKAVFATRAGETGVQDSELEVTRSKSLDIIIVDDPRLAWANIMLKLGPVDKPQLQACVECSVETTQRCRYCQVPVHATFACQSTHQNTCPEWPRNIIIVAEEGQLPSVELKNNICSECTSVAAYGCKQPGCPSYVCSMHCGAVHYARVHPTVRHASTDAPQPEDAQRALVNDNLLLGYALKRRSLAFDQARLTDYMVSERWSNIMLECLTTDPPRGYAPVSLEQLSRADQALFLHMMRNTTEGIRMSSTMYSLDVRLLLQPLQGHGKRQEPDSPVKEKDEGPVAKMQKTAEHLNDRVENLQDEGQQKPSKDQGHGKRGSAANSGKETSIPFVFSLSGCKEAQAEQVMPGAHWPRCSTWNCRRKTMNFCRRCWCTYCWRCLQSHQCHYPEPDWHMVQIGHRQTNH